MIVDPEVSLVIPIYNEEEVLVKRLDYILSKTEAILNNFEIITVENGSKDRTLSILNEYSRSVSKIKVVVCGTPDYGEAVREGILRSRGPIVHICQLDFFDPDFFSESLETLSEENPLTIGSRNRRSFDRRPLERRILTVGLNLALKVFFDFKGTDTHGLKTFFRHRLIGYVENCKMRRGMFDTELVLRAQYDGMEIIERAVRADEIRLMKNTYMQKIFRNLKDLVVMKGVFLKENVAKK